MSFIKKIRRNAYMSINVNNIIEFILIKKNAYRFKKSIYLMN